MSGLARVIQGPQRPEPRLTVALEAAAIPEGPIAVISAGWQEAEGDLEELEGLVGRPLRELGLYERTERLFQHDSDLHEAYRQRQDRLMQLQRLYRLRLRQLALAARRMLTSEVDREFRDPEVRHAIAQLRALDRHHLQRTEDIQKEFTTAAAVLGSQAVADLAGEVAEIASGCTAVLIAGGNVLVLLNRMRLFHVADVLERMPVIAWSAGAMVLADQIVLYHDRAPGKRREPELMGTGLGIVPGHVFLPDATNRLKPGETARHKLMSQRFAPAACATLDNGSMLRFEGHRLISAEATQTLTRRGQLIPMVSS